MKLLLINPRFPESFWSLKLALDKYLPNKRAVNPPLGLATLAALSPDNWEIEIIDENIETIPLEPDADIIGVCGMGVQSNRQQELLTFYRNKGYFVVAGGSYASLCPELYESIADCTVAGESEYIWKDFCRDFEFGVTRKLYQETGTVDLHDSPTPRFDLLKLDKYQSVSLQFSRGCPYRCEFCDIIVMFGRRPRTKTVEQVGRELDMLRTAGVKNIFFVDDNLIGNKPLAKKLMQFLADYQREHNYNFHFGTEASINFAHDDELLRLFRAANFGWVFIGIESPDEDSLKETKKFQNTREGHDMLDSIRHIYSYGIEVLAGFIIGFDNDTTKTFNIQYNFIMRSGIQAAMVGLLTAAPKTPLYKRLEKEGRLILDASNYDNTKLGTNIIPKGMGYDEMVTGYRELYYRLLSDRSIADRIRNKTRFLENPLYKSTFSMPTKLNVLRKLFTSEIVPGGFSRIYHFLRSFPLTKPLYWPVVVQDWIFGLSMKDYVDRHFITEFESVNHATPSYLKVIEESFQRYVRLGALELSLNQVKNAATNLSISMKGFLGKDFFIPAANHLEKVLENTPTHITLDIEDFQESQLQYLNALLKRLSRYGDRISINVHEKFRSLVKIDSSVFNLVLVEHTKV